MYRGGRKGSTFRADGILYETRKVFLIMKLTRCISFILLIFMLILTACDSSGTDSSLPELDEDENAAIEYETIEYEQIQNVYGKITEKLGSDTLVLKSQTPKQIEQCGETVCIITENADEWCVNDEIDVTFYKMHRPQTKNGIARIIAYEVMPLHLCYKPIIYFYPEEATQCSAELSMTDGYLTCTYPEYNNNGWSNFTAQPDGTLVFPDGKEYYALYWEGVNNTDWDFSTGFCVSGKDTMRFLEWALAKQGLTAREANEFIIYWLPLMQENPYNVISFQKETYTESALLSVSPAPQSMLRVFMAYYPSDVEIDIEPQEFDEFNRNGFTVVEWGGSIAQMP